MMTEPQLTGSDMDNAPILSDHDLDILFRKARTHNSWQDKDVSDVMLQALYDLLKWGPTSMNCCPMRVVFVKSKTAKERLSPHMSESNRDKTMAAPVTAIIANDLEFYEKMPILVPHNPNARDVFAGKEKLAQETAMRNATLQAGYLILAARSLGLDCGPMSGFKKQGVKDEFFPDRNVEVNFLCNIGYGTPEGLHPRAPRLDFDDACDII